MANFFCVLILIICLQLRDAFSENLTYLSVSDWWEKAGFYQIYPRSYKDSNGDGIGDLNGITEKLPYLKSIGVKAFWLSPIYPSPMADFGYDISDFRGIQPEYGTMADFAAMVAKKNELGLKLILDFVPNHSSDEHEWFIKSEQKVSGYEDYYVWHDGTPGSDPTRNDPPNNWVEAFRGSAWKWSDKRKQYYLHQFHYKQPDLNYRNPTVVTEMKNVLTFWLDQGVDGFRIDAVPCMFEDENFPNEPPSGNSDDPLRPEYLNHIYTQDLPETVDMVYQWRELLDNYKKQKGGDTRVLMTEAWSSLDIVSTYFQDQNKRQGSQMPFNFQLIMRLDQNSKAADFKTVIDSWIKTVPSGHVPNWVLGNHDKRRVASRMGGEHMADLMEMVELSLPGVSVTYQGEEIGMTDYELTWADTKDPAACQTSSTDYQKYTRDPARTPFHWNTTSMAGFTMGTSTWLPINPIYTTVNVETELNTDKSHIKVFKRLMELRDKDEFHTVSYGTDTLGESVFAILRSGPVLHKSRVYVTLVNIANKDATVNVQNVFKKFEIEPVDKLYVEVASVSSGRSEGDSIKTDSLLLLPYEGLVLRSTAVTLILSKLLVLIAIIKAFLFQ
ncbi:maltase 2-like isoform X2 [Topomyia yanbarensis]|uniref:maltase 2-like isoform X2 n=1 Tax=Topomyia yanbarensis TaxID=2498891 RepID=UPI00273BB071|nr:maltase 2-like isoform X2 [Topomyia yanbarensis]